MDLGSVGCGVGWVVIRLNSCVSVLLKLLFDNLLSSASRWVGRVGWSGRVFGLSLFGCVRARAFVGYCERGRVVAGT